VHLDSVAANNPPELETKIEQQIQMSEIQKRLLDEQTIFITESSKTCGDN
jgi:hypothetical protein